MAISWDDFIVRVDRIPKRNAYIYLSFLLCGFLLATVINDVVHLTITEKTWNTTSKFTMALLLVHTLGFYFGVLGYIYTNEAEGWKSRMSLIALVGIVGNFSAFIFRITVEIAAISYREEFYNLASESGK